MFSDDIFKGYEKLQKKVTDTIHSHQDLLLSAFAEGQKRGIIVDIEPQHLFVIVMGTPRLLVTRWRGSGFAFDLVKEGEKLWNSLEVLLTC